MQQDVDGKLVYYFVDKETYDPSADVAGQCVFTKNNDKVVCKHPHPRGVCRQTALDRPRF
jgi:hypothetical protein